MKLLILILCLSCTVQAWDDEWEYDEIALQGDARFLNVSFDGIFNNSLLTLAGIFIVGVIMFELALYALDVYYNQTYLNNRIDNRYDKYGSQNDPNYMLWEQVYPKYYDQYQQTFRGRKDYGVWKNIAKIPQWLTLAYDMYETSSDLLNDLDCQKKAICEVYQNALELGEISTRARHSLDFLDSASVLSVPDEFLNIIDEFTDAQQAGKANEFQCQDLYLCPNSLVQLKRMYNQI